MRRTAFFDSRMKNCTAVGPCATVCNIMTSNTTVRHEAPTHDPAELGELERSILELVWRNRIQSADQVRERLEQAGRPLKESTIRTVLRRLEEKGYLEHTLENRTFLYRPAETRQAVAGRAVQRIVDWFCEGSVEALLVGMVDSKMLDRDELQRLADRIARSRSNDPQSTPKKAKK
jgi:BlaI family penicillinase repressor